MPTGRYLVLFYDYVEDVLERRPPHRTAHLALVQEWVDRGAIVMAGALGEPPSGAAIVFDVAAPAEVERFAEADPYVAAGLVSGRRIVPWTVVASA
jgi:uncharacterized protein YciI